MPIVAVAQDDSSSEPDIAFIASDVQYPTDSWILDSGASHHMCPNREWFSTYEKVDGGNISMVINVVCRSIGSGTI